MPKSGEESEGADADHGSKQNTDTEADEEFTSADESARSSTARSNAVGKPRGSALRQTMQEKNESLRKDAVARADKYLLANLDASSSNASR